MYKICAAIAIIGMALPCPLWPQQKIAFTWDDLPAHGSLPPGESRQQVINALISTIEAEHMPAPYGFVNAKQVEAEPNLIGVLDAWRKAGFPLGNHTWSHLNLNASTAAVSDWEEEVLKNEPVLKRQMGGADFHGCDSRIFQKGARWRTGSRRGAFLRHTATRSQASQ